MITGAAGMLGRTLVRKLKDHDLIPVDLEDFDLTNAGATGRAIGKIRPEVLLHCGAMTDVDRCETEKNLAWQTNAFGAGNVALACAGHKVRMIHFSTDYVFAGDGQRPYHEWDEPHPRTVYGKSKLVGEKAVRTHCPDHLILRIAWLYGPGGPSFLHTMMRLSKTKEILKVVDDQRGNPTSTDAVAGQIGKLLESPVGGTMHLTCEGETSWFGFAQEIFRLAGIEQNVQPCDTESFPRPAPRPQNSCLENRALRLNGLSPMPDWHEALKTFFEEHPDG